jgi:hypothetical protein
MLKSTCHETHQRGVAPLLRPHIIHLGPPVFKQAACVLPFDCKRFASEFSSEL